LTQLTLLKLLGIAAILQYLFYLTLTAFPIESLKKGNLTLNKSHESTLASANP